MRMILIIVGFVLAIAALMFVLDGPQTTTGVTEAVNATITNPYCQSGNLCSTIPDGDIMAVTNCPLTPGDISQCNRDFYSWQAFVALMWPAEIQGGEITPMANLTDSGTPAWQFYMDPNDIFLPEAVKPTWSTEQTIPASCSGVGSAATTRVLTQFTKGSPSLDYIDDPNSFIEATVTQPLIDQGMNFVVYEIRLNEADFNFIVDSDNEYYNADKVNAVTDTGKFELPTDAIELKAAWRIIPDSMPASERATYYTQNAKIVLPANNVEGATGEVCIERTIGLIGFHINHNGQWGTFEHLGNVDGSNPTLYNPNCSSTNCPPNEFPTDMDGHTIPPNEWKWDTSGDQSAALYVGYPNVPSQITRSAAVVANMSPGLNTWWKETLQGTVWENYFQITTNWLELGTPQSSPDLNTALESYVITVFGPGSSFNSCIGCHSTAVTTTNINTQNSFMYQRACPPRPTSPLEPYPTYCQLVTDE